MATIREGKDQEMLGNPYGIATYSGFDLGHKHASTEIFGLLIPYEVRDAVTGDEHKLSNISKEKSYTLQAPLMSEVWKNKEWFLVPRMAILPNAWDKIYTQPTVGQDVDATKVGTSIDATTWSAFLQRITNSYASLISQIYTYTSGGTPIYTPTELITKYIQLLIINEYIFSYGSLLNRLGCSMASLYVAENKQPFDINFDIAITSMLNGWKVEWDSNGEIYTVSKIVEDGSTNMITVREFIQKCRDNLNFEIFGIYNSSTEFIRLDSTDANDITKIKAWFTTVYNSIKNTGKGGHTYVYSQPVDLARLWAYQMICAEYYTDDQIDYIYNAQIYREYISDLVKKIMNSLGQGLSDTYFTLNGINIPYDWCSAHYFENIANHLATTNQETLDYCTALFNINRSLKYKDYFVGGRTRPIATNDVMVSTVGNQFSVINLSKSTQETRFRMAIQRIGRKIGEFAKGLLGVDQAPDYHYPLWIGKTTDVIHAVETENTGTDQYTKNYAVTSRFSGFSNEYGFLARCDRDCILMGITYYDVERYYFRGVDRHFMHVDRFDYFNQFMQYTGDQPVFSEEYDAAMTGAAATYFAYKPTYEEFKEGINRADSGFVVALDGFIFLDDVNEKKFYNKNQHMNNHVSPDFIRSKPTELDRFYTQITGFSLGTYFHFICIYDNGDNSKRPMAYNPTINI